MKENVSSAEQTGDPGIQTATDQKQALIDYLSGFINAPRRQLLQQILADRTRYLTVVLEDIYYPQNASAVLRSCECLGIQELHVSAGISLYSLLRRLRGSDVNWHLSKEDQADLYIDWLVKSTPTGRQLKLRFLEQYPAS